MGNGKPIFYDEERRRWRRTRRVMEIAGALFAFVLVVFIVDIFRNPDLGASLLPDRHPIRHAIRQSQARQSYAGAARPQETCRGTWQTARPL